MQTKKNDMGVSPVIAVILMVAITVVLAGVVFLWAQSFTDQAGDDVKTLNIKVELDRDGQSATQGLLTIEVLGGTINWNNYKILVNNVQVYNMDAVGGTGNVAVGTTIAAAFTTNDVAQSTAGDSVNFSQLTLTGLVAGSPYNVKIVDIDGNRVAWNSDNVIASN